MPGGTRAEVSLKESIVQLMSQAHYLAHPRTRALVPIINGTFGVVSHLSEENFKLENHRGRMVARKTALSVFDKFIEALNKVYPLLVS